MSNVGRYVMRTLSDRMIQPGRWHRVKEDHGDYVTTRCGRTLGGRRANIRWNDRLLDYQRGADHTLAFSDFPRDARTADRDDTNICGRCAIA